MKHVTAARGDGWLRTEKHGACAARYFMVARRILTGPRTGTFVIDGVLKTELAIIMLSAISGGAMLELADGRLFPIEIIKAQGMGAVFAASGAAPMF